MHPLLSKASLIGIGAVTATVGGGFAAVHAATAPPPPTSGTAAHAAHKGGALARVAKGLLAGTAIGKVTAEATTGGTLGGGTISITEPNGTSITFSLPKTNHIFLYHGKGQKVTKETLSAIPTGEVVIVKGRQPKTSTTPIGVVVLDTGTHSA